MKCWNCKKNNKNKGYNYEYCSECGLYIESLHQPDLENIIELLEKMVERWGLKKSISFFKRREDNGVVFKYKGIKAILNHVFHDDDITIGELNALIKAISYLSKEFEMNITELAINLFWFAKDFFNSHQSHPYLHEINLSFKDEKIELWLSFGPTQQTAKWMLSSIDKININDSHFSHVYQGFHLLYHRGRIISGSYVDEWDVDEFINYWKKNINLVKTSTPEETISLYQKMYDDGKIKKEKFDYIKGRLSGKKNQILIIPEISIVFAWEYQEASELGLEAFGKQIKDKIHIALKEMKLYKD